MRLLSSARPASTSLCLPSPASFWLEVVEDFVATGEVMGVLEEVEDFIGFNFWRCTSKQDSKLA